MKVLATLFHSLLDFVFPPRADEVLVRALDVRSVSELVAPELIEATQPATTALMSFDDSNVRALIHEAKYHDSQKAQQLLGNVLAEYLVELGTDSFDTCVLVPLPLSKKRLRERGFNQCERVATLALSGGAERIAVDATLLIRTKDTEHQARLTRAERLTNVRDAFSAPQALDASLTYVLFDDVVTTGSTMQAGIAALRAAGARHILPLTLAYAP